MACDAISLQAFSPSELNSTHFRNALWPRSFATPFAMVANPVFVQPLRLP